MSLIWVHNMDLFITLHSGFLNHKLLPRKFVFPVFTLVQSKNYIKFYFITKIFFKISPPYLLDQIH